MPAPDARHYLLITPFIIFRCVFDYVRYAYAPPLMPPATPIFLLFAMPLMPPCCFVLPPRLDATPVYYAPIIFARLRRHAIRIADIFPIMLLQHVLRHFA